MLIYLSEKIGHAWHFKEAKEGVLQLTEERDKTNGNGAPTVSFKLNSGCSAADR